jgi:hypothetical protein
MGRNLQACILIPLFLGASRTIHKLDQGIIWTPPPPIPLTPEQIAAAKAIAEQKKKAGEAAALKYNQDLAAKGDAWFVPHGGALS